MMGLVSLQEEEKESELSLSLPCEDKARRELSACQEEGPHQELNWPAP